MASRDMLAACHPVLASGTGHAFGCSSIVVDKSKEYFVRSVISQDGHLRLGGTMPVATLCNVGNCFPVIYACVAFEGRAKLERPMVGEPTCPCPPSGCVPLCFVYAPVRIPTLDWQACKETASRKMQTSRLGECDVKSQRQQRGRPARSRIRVRPRRWKSTASASAVPGALPRMVPM